MKKIWPLFNMLQIIIVLGQVVETPPNIEIIMDSLSDIVNLKLLPKGFIDDMMATITGTS